MYQTEKDASTLICPAPTGFSNCQGSRCMAWQFSEFQLASRNSTALNPEAKTIEEAGERPRFVPDFFEFWPADDGEPAYWAEPDHMRLARRLGYCKLIHPDGE